MDLKGSRQGWDHGRLPGGGHEKCQGLNGEVVRLRWEQVCLVSESGLCVEEEAERLFWEEEVEKEQRHVANGDHIQG